MKAMATVGAKGVGGGEEEWHCDVKGCVQRVTMLCGAIQGRTTGLYKPGVRWWWFLYLPQEGG
jgi:hypothetical protein